MYLNLTTQYDFQNSLYLDWVSLFCNGMSTLAALVTGLLKTICGWSGPDHIGNAMEVCVPTECFVAQVKPKIHFSYWYY